MEDPYNMPRKSNARLARELEFLRTMDSASAEKALTEIKEQARPPGWPSELEKAATERAGSP